MEMLKQLATFVVLSTCLPACLTNPVYGPLPEAAAPDRARAVSSRAAAVEALMAQGALPEAERALAQASSRDPADLQSRIWSALVAELLADEDAGFEQLLWACRIPDPVAELAIWEAYRLFDRRSQATALERVLAQVAASQDTPPLVRARALHFLGHTQRYLGRFDEARRNFSRLGYVRQWMMIGPFDNDQNSGFDTSYPPETDALDYERVYPGKLRPVAYRPVRHFDAAGRVNLKALIDPSRWSTAYLVTWIHSAERQPAAFRLAAFRDVKLWLNDRLLLSENESELAALDQHVAGGVLEPGWNKVLVKVCQRTGPWQLGLRVTDLQGRPLSGIRFDRAVHAHPNRRDDTTELPRADSLQAWLADQADTPFTRVLRARLALRFGRYKSAVRQAASLAAAYPKSPLAQMFLFTAHLQADHEGSALRALSAADAAAPGLPQAILARSGYEQRHKRIDRAMRTLKPLLEAQPDLPAARMARISLLRARGWNADALFALEDFVRLQPDRAWTYRALAGTRFALLQMNEGMSALRRALALRADHKQTYDDLVNRELLRGQARQALQIIRTRSAVFPDQMAAALQEASVLLAQSRADKALAVCARIEEIAPDYWYLHKLKADILYRQGRRAQAIESYSRSLACAPDNPKLRDYMDFLVHRPDPAFEHYAIGPAEVERLIAGRRERAAHPDAEALFLLDGQITHVFQDGSAKHKVHQIYLVLNERGQRRFSKVRVPAGSSFRLEVAETIQADGSRQEATSIRRGAIHFPSLEPGSVIHLAYTYDSPSSSWMEDHFAMSYNFQGRDPTIAARWVLVTPKDKALKVLKRGADIIEKHEKLGDEEVRIFTAGQVPMLHRESWRPPLRDLRQAVYVSTVPSWEALARWQNSLIQDQFEIDDDIAHKTDELAAGCKTVEEKIAAVYGFVAKDIRYLNHDVGIFGKKPNKAINIFENRFGDCKDKATLMIAMLRHLGIDASYAAIRTRDRGPVFWEVPYAQTNHIITYIPKQTGLDTAMFVDGTSRFGNVHNLPERDQGVRALILDGRSFQLLDTPEAGAAESGYDTQLDMTLDGQGGFLVQVKDTWRGWYARRQRAGLNTEGKRLEELGKSVNFRFPGATVREATFSGLDDLSPSAGATYEMDVPQRVRREGDSLRFRLLWPSRLAAWLAQEPERRYDLVNLYPFRTTVRASLRIPEGYRVKQLPKESRIESDALSYSLHCVQEGEAIVCSRRFEMKVRRVLQADYLAFRALCLEADRAEEQDVVLAPTTE